MTKPPAPYRLGLVHISDIHWEYDDQTLFQPSPYADHKIDFYATHERFMRSLLASVDAISQETDHLILALGGDNFYKSNYLKTNAACLEYNVLRPILTKRKCDGSPLFSHVVAVPGNHDIVDPNRASDDAEEKIGGVPNGDDRLDKYYRFRKWIDSLKQFLPAETKVQTPFDDDCVLRLELPSQLKKGKKGTIALWLINSSEKCGSLDSVENQILQFRKQIEAKVSELKKSTDDNPLESEGYAELIKILNDLIPQSANKKKGNNPNFYDPGYVSPKDSARCENELANVDDHIRIAILHHNHLPTINDDALKYRFLNVSDFNNCLLRNNFRIVLHGHQHLGEIAGYSKFGAGDLNPYSSYIQDGFLAMGSPAFDIGSHNTEHTGYSIIKLEIDASSDVCGVRVDRHIWDNGDRSFGVITTNHDIAMRPVTDPIRLKSMRDVNRIVFSERSVRGILRGIDSLEYFQNHAERLRMKIPDFNHIRAIYALSVFNPGDWLSSKIPEFLYPLGRENLKRAAQLSPHRDLMLHRYSKPLFHAIRTSSENAALSGISKLYKISSRLKREGYIQAHQFIARKIDAFGNDIRQMSILGQGYHETQSGQFDFSKLIVKAGAARPFAKYSGRHYFETSQVNEIFEFPRIVLWNPEDFRKPSSLDIIEFHENMGFPLFWIHPDFLRTRKGRRRKSLGYVSSITYDPTNPDEQWVDEHMHDGGGARVDLSEDFIVQVWGGAPALWTLDKEPMGLIPDEFNKLGRKNRAIHEFIWLLGHPSITFAADAWAAAFAGDSTFEDFIACLDGKLQAHQR